MNRRKRCNAWLMVAVTRTTIESSTTKLETAARTLELGPCNP